MWLRGAHCSSGKTDTKERRYPYHFKWRWVLWRKQNAMTGKWMIRESLSLKGWHGSWDLKRRKEPTILHRMGRCPGLTGHLRKARRQEGSDTSENESHQEEPLTLGVTTFIASSLINHSSTAVLQCYEESVTFFSFQNWPSEISLFDNVDVCHIMSSSDYLQGTQFHLYNTSDF